MPLPKTALLLIGQKMKDRGLAADSSSPASSSAKEEAPDEEAAEEKDPHYQHLVEVAADLIKSIKEGDPEAVAECFEEMFQCCDAMPHKEGEHTDDEEY